jgi:hypothetical protein
MKRRALSIAVFLLLLTTSASAWWPISPYWRGGLPWWYNGLTFYAPFDSPSDPLRLIRGTGSLSFTRATPATFVHPTTGLVTTAGNNLFTYSDDLSNAAWTKAACSMVLSSEPHPVSGSTQEVYKYVPVADNTSANFYRAAPTLTAGASYVISFYAKQAGNLRYFRHIGGTGFSARGTILYDFQDNTIVSSNGTATVIGNGWVRLSAVVVSSGSGDIVHYFRQSDSAGNSVASDGTSGFYITGLQIEPAFGTTPGSYVKTTTAAASALRIEANGALIEGQRTNLAKKSESFDNVTETNGWLWATNTTATLDSNEAPDGTTTADNVTFTTNSALQQMVQGLADNTTVSFSVYAKKPASGGATHICLVSNNSIAWNTGLASKSELSSSWQRYSVSGVQRTASNNAYFKIGTQDIAGNYVSDCAGKIILWGAQVEVGAFPSSYIPTTTAAATRNADVLTINYVGNLDNTVGAAAATLTRKADSTDYQPVFMNSAGTGIPLYIHQTSDKGSVYDGTTILQGPAATALNTPVKIASTWFGTTGGLKVTTDGGEVSTGNFDGSFAFSGNMHIGGNSGMSLPLWGNIKNLRIWNKAFTDSQLQAITR